ncbi:Phosphoglycerate dehydrogenase [Pedococcus dokdonensis]|uniref:Phosphoglycerate dehydrogenase n=1 Tax=Pedococcus dokdonensis TaxID=443156 RepID=A0A1H0LIT8_9MICO|nr:2-hydroxyacid dehydrogenase [Pedococcus dokdonensis]SDO68147.1 Phosphoglycerate dehydrogenase [Pedococcus dokdonensis]
MTLVTLPGREWVQAVGPISGLELAVWEMDGPPDRADEVRVVVPPYVGAGPRLGRLAEVPHLELVQLLTAGYDDVLSVLPDGVQLANATGVHDASTAELAVALTLASLRDFPDFFAAQRDRTWLPSVFHHALADKRVLVLGYGSIGRAVAARLTPFEVQVTAVASRARAGDDLVRSVHGVDELPVLLPDHDVVIVIVPLSEHTAGLVDDAFLAAMPDGALLVNVARGGVVDTDALVRHAQAGRIRAALDVTDPEPLPGDHPLWVTPNVLITPHVGGTSTAFMPRAARLLQDQLGAYAAGRPLRNLVT